MDFLSKSEINPEISFQKKLKKKERIVLNDNKLINQLIVNS